MQGVFHIFRNVIFIYVEFLEMILKRASETSTAVEPVK